ncbi:MAG: rod shape-determining protein MreC [Bacteroidota bacterium]
MERLLRIFYNNGSFFTFVGLQLLCFYLIINHNSTQSEIALETWSVRTGKIKSLLTHINGYLDVREQDEVHRREIARLRGLLPSAQYNTEAQVDSIKDPSQLQRYNFLATRIVNRSPYKPNNTFVIDRGEQFGVQTGQGVIDDRGLLGIIDQITARHARVISILHQQTRISAGLPNGSFGTLRWDGQTPREMTMTDLPDYVTVNIGDTVLTTGFSNIFPTAQPIGTVAGIEIQPGTGNQHLRVTLLNEPLTSSYGYVVQDLFKEELEALKKSN